MSFYTTDVPGGSSSYRVYQSLIVDLVLEAHSTRIGLSVAIFVYGRVLVGAHIHRRQFAGNIPVWAPTTS